MYLIKFGYLGFLLTFFLLSLSFSSDRVIVDMGLLVWEGPWMLLLALLTFLTSVLMFSVAYYNRWLEIKQAEKDIEETQASIKRGEELLKQIKEKAEEKKT